MYLYLVDSFVQDKKFDQELIHIQSRVQDLGISGRFEKLTILKSIKGIVEDAERKGVKTLVAIGNNRTFNEMIGHIKNSKITLALIPIGETNNSIAEALHIPKGVEACSTLSKRIIKKMDVGKVNGRFFFSSLSFPFSNTLNVECDKSFKLISQEGATVSIVNFCSAGHKGNAQDGRLETVIQENDTQSFFSFFTKKKPAESRTIIPAKHIQIKSSEGKIPIYSEGELVVKTPACVEIASKKIRIIAGV